MPINLGGGAHFQRAHVIAGQFEFMPVSRLAVHSKHRLELPQTIWLRNTTRHSPCFMLTCIDWLDGVPAMTGTDASPTPRRQSARLQQFSFATASCAMIEMGSYMLSECRNRPYTVEDAAQPAISGEHVVQILPHSLLERANTFRAIDSVRQVSCRNTSALGCLIFMLTCPSGTFVHIC